MEDLKQTNNSLYYFDDLVIDRENFRFLKQNEPKSLTPRAFDVLVYLIEHRGRVVEKQELFEAIWKETFVTDNALMRAVKEIRRELGDNANAPRYVETVHKRGYRFMAEVSESAEMSEPPAENIGFFENEPVAEEKTRHSSSRSNKLKWLWATAAVALLAIGAFTFWFFAYRNAKRIESIAVLPFTNESGNPEMDYLSDGMTETLIGSLSQLPHLNVKARNSVFRYKGKEISPQAIGRELNVQAILTGRVIQHGDDLMLYLSLVDAATENNIWSRQYSRKMTNLVVLQSDIARDVANGLGAKLSGEDEQRVAKNYTKNQEAYQFYLKGRYHVLTTRQSGAEIGISYYRQAIEIDPNYALAYAGIAEACVGRAFGSEMPSAEVFTNAKEAAQKAVELDEQLAEAHVALGWISLFYDWDWEASENHVKRALELNPNNADAHLASGMLFCDTGRCDNGLAELKRAVELDPLNLRNNAVEGEYLYFAGRTDEALARFQKTFELEPNFYLAHLFASSAYTDQGRFAEAITEAQTAKKLNPIGSVPIAFLGYALAKSGNQAEALTLLEELLRISTKRYVSPYNIALIYNGLDDRDQTLAWLERAIEQRDLRMTFLKVEPKWNNLRSDARFQEIIRRVGI